MKKRLISVLLCLLLIISSFPAAAFAEGEDIASGTWGSCPWVIDADGVLTIGEDGKTYNDLTNHAYNKKAPWADSKDEIKEVRFKGNVVAPKNLQYLFQDHKTLESFCVEGLDMENTVSIEGMFTGCESLKTIDLNGANTKNVTTMRNLFNGCSSLEEIDLRGLNTEKVQYMHGMFQNCSSLRAVDLSVLNTPSLTYFTSADTGFFRGCSSLVDVKFGGGFDTSKVESFSGLFIQCSSLKDVDLSGLDFSSAKYLNSLFKECTSLEYVDLSAIDTDTIVSVESMFWGCSALKDVEFEGFDTSSVTDFGMMFARCSSLKTIDLSPLDTSSAKRMNAMFSGCTSMEELDLSTFDTTNIDYIAWMFSTMVSLKKLDISGFDFSNIRSGWGLFENCVSLEELDLRGFDFSSLNFAHSMFAWVPKFTVDEDFVFLDKCLFGNDVKREEDGLMYTESELVAKGSLAGTYSLDGVLLPLYRSDGTLGIGNLWEVHSTESRFTGYCINRNRSGVGMVLDKIEATEEIIINDLLTDKDGEKTDTYGYAPLGNNMREALSTLIWFGFEQGTDRGGIQSKYKLNDAEFLDVTQQAIWDFTNRYEEKWGPENFTGRKLDAYNELVSKKYSDIGTDVTLYIYRAQDTSRQNLLSVEGANTGKYGGFLLKKSDQEGKPLPGAVFELYDMDDNLVMGDLVSQQNGLFGVYRMSEGHGLPLGEYYLKEVKAPRGYLLDDSKIGIEVVEDQDMFIKIDFYQAVWNKPDPDWHASGIRIRKIDKQTGEGLIGAEFTIYDENGDEVEVITTGENGLAKSGPRSIEWDKEYTFRETKAPVGYIMDTSAQTVKITSGSAIDGEYTEVIEVINEKKTGSFTLSASKSVVDRNGDEYEYDMSGFEFELVDADGEVIETAAADEDGNVEFSPIDVTIEDGFVNYTIREVKGDDSDIFYDDHEESVSVIVRDGEGDELDIEVVYDHDGAVFENRFIGPEEVVYGVEYYYQNKKGVYPEKANDSREDIGLSGDNVVVTTDDKTPKSLSGIKASDYKLDESRNTYWEGKLATGGGIIFEGDVATGSALKVYFKYVKKNDPKPSGGDTPLNKEDHIAYIVGYEDGTVRPENNITRAEVATVFFRLLTDEVRSKNLSETNSFNDVREEDWFNTAVSTLEKMNILKGYSDGGFHPNDAITRAEFTAIAARFDSSNTEAKAPFSDVSDHWAYSDLSKAAENGWVNGYADGSFKPDQKITRAEVMAIVNRVLERAPKSKDDLHSRMVKWSDNADTSKWYYLDVQEATNSHEYEKSGKHETWTKITSVPNWARYE